MSMVSLVNEKLAVNISPHGAELQEVQYLPQNRECLWHGDPAVWGRRAPWLFPVIGACAAGKIKVGSTEYPMARHGFARDMPWKVLNHERDTVSFQLTSNDQTLQQYPFRFAISLQYALRGARIEISCTIENRESERSMAYQWGGHPAFQLDGELDGSYYLHFGHEQAYVERHLLNDEGLFSGKTEKVALEKGKLPITTHLFDKDAIVLKNTGIEKVRLHNADGCGLEVSFPGHSHLGIWAKPGAPFVCIEPWNGCADSHDFGGSFYQKEGAVVLEPRSHNQHQTTYSFW